MGDFTFWISVSHSTLTRSFLVSAIGANKTSTVLLSFKCTNTQECAHSNFTTGQWWTFGFPKYLMLATEILEPLVCDSSELKVYAQNLTNIKVFLALFKPSKNLRLWFQLDYDSCIMAIRSSLKTATTFIRRSPTEIRVNNYNPACLQACRANQDIQFILDVVACASHITSYIANGARGMSDLLRKACEEARLGNSKLHSLELRQNAQNC